MIGVFDDDGVCVSVSDRDTGAPGVRMEVPRGSRPQGIWFDGDDVQDSAPETLGLPDVIDVEDGLFTMPLPAGVVVDVNGERQRGTLAIDPDAGTAFGLIIRGAQSGFHAIKVKSYADHRREAYPPVGDQLDAIWKWLDTQPQNSESEAMLAAVQSVKAAIPKP